MLQPSSTMLWIPSKKTLNWSQHITKSKQQPKYHGHHVIPETNMGGLEKAGGCR